MVCESQDFGEDDIYEFIEGFFSISKYRVERQCKGICGVAYKGNKRICGASCRNLGNYSEEELYNLKNDLKQKLVKKGVNINSEGIKEKIANAINNALN